MATSAAGYMNTLRSTNITMGAHEYPNGQIKVSGTWYNYGSDYTFKLYICDSNGSNAISLGTFYMVGATANGPSSSYVDSTKATVSNRTEYKGKTLYLKAVINYGNEPYASDLKQNGLSVTIPTSQDVYTITLQNDGHGSLAASQGTATEGTVITLTPTPQLGYKFSSYTKTNVSFTDSTHKFTMPSSNVTIRANFTQKTYTITTAASPSGAGTVSSSANTAHYQDLITVTQTPAAGYTFDNFTISPSTTGIDENGQFSMPPKNVTVTANYSTAGSTVSVNTTQLVGGENITITITPGSSSYSHKYKVSFGSGMESDWITVAAGTTTATYTVPIAWCSSVTDSATKSGGTITLQAYSGNTLISTNAKSNLTFVVPVSVVPTLPTLTVSPALTINGVTYANIGNHYIQNHCGVRVQVTATGTYSSTIEEYRVLMTKPDGSMHFENTFASSLDWTSPLLDQAGTITLNITAFDSRGRSASTTTTITVQKYSFPWGSIIAWRVNNSGQIDPTGTYAKYKITKHFLNIGSNTLTATLSFGNASATISSDTGDILPNNKQIVAVGTDDYATLTLTDSFESATFVSPIFDAKYAFTPQNT